MNTYELTLITADKASLDAATKAVTSFIKKAKGEVNKEEDWGEKTLAYPIKKNTTGHYVHLLITMPAEEQPKLEQTLRINETLLRYLFVRV